MTPDLEALARRAVKCPRFRWLPGMAYWMTEYIDADDGWMDPWRERIEWGGPEEPFAAHLDGPTSGDTAIIGPDLSDPATLGCLLALVREAWQDPRMGLVHYSAGGWCLVTGDGLARMGGSATDAELLVSALEAAPG